MTFRDRIETFCRSGGAKPSPAWLDAMATIGVILRGHYKMDDREWQLFAGQWGHECFGLGLRGMQENMNYSPSRMVEVFSYRLRLARDTKGLFPRSMSLQDIARALDNDHKQFVEVVYGGRMGNPPGRAWEFIGRGPTQITGADNYRAITAEIRKQPGGETCPDLIEHPEVLSDVPEWGVRSAFADWAIKGARKYVKGSTSDFERISALINTGSASRWSIVNGKESRRRWYSRAQRAFPLGSGYADQPFIETPPLPVANHEQVHSGQPAGGANDTTAIAMGDDGPKVAIAQQRLANLNYNVGKVDGIAGPITMDAVAAFQRRNGFALGPELTHEQYEHLCSEDAVPFEAPEGRQTATAKTLAKQGNPKVKAAETGKKVAAGGGIVLTSVTAMPSIVEVTDTIRNVNSLTDAANALWPALQSSWPALVIIAGAGVCWLLFNHISSREVADHRAGNTIGPDQ